MVLQRKPVCLTRWTTVWPSSEYLFKRSVLSVRRNAFSVLCFWDECYIEDLRNEDSDSWDEFSWQKAFCWAAKLIWISLTVWLDEILCLLVSLSPLPSMKCHKKCYYHHLRRLVKNIGGGGKPKYLLAQRVVLTKQGTGVSKLLGGYAPELPPQSLYLWLPSFCNHIIIMILHLYIATARGIHQRSS